MNDEAHASPRDLDPWIVLPALGLLAVGLVNLHELANTSPPLAGLLARQYLWIGLGISASAGTYHLARNDRHRGLSWVHAVALLAVFACIVGFGETFHGARRWMHVGPLTIHPAVFLAPGVAVAVARYFGDAPLGSRGFARTLVGVLALVTVPVALVAAQPDLGAAALLLAVAATTLLVTPRATRSLALLALSVAPLLLVPGLLMRDYQLARLRAFLHAERHSDLAWQAAQAHSAIVSGRWYGAERSPYRFHQLPDQHTDFAIASWANHHGFVGVALVLGLYATLVLRVFDTARRSTDRYDLAVCVGVGALVFWQCVLNVSMALGLAPVMGVGAPLVSYGGSSLFVTLAALGVVVGVRARIERAPREPAAPGPERLYRGAP